MLPAARALRSWSEFAYQSRCLKDLFAMAFQTYEELVLDHAWAAWEELVQEKRAKKVMAKVINMLNGTALHDSFHTWLRLAMGGARWQLMLAARKQQEAVLARKMLRSWLYVAHHDKSRVLLPMFLARGQQRLLLRTMRAWGPSKSHWAAE